jgi:hypothetical protein
MSDLLIKPLRAYEDRGTIRDVDNEPYAAPVWLAKELEQLNLCKIVGENAALAESQDATSALKIAKKGQRWIVADSQGAQVGDFIGKRDEAEVEVARLLAVSQSAPAVVPTPVESLAPSADTLVADVNMSPAIVPAPPLQE